MKSKFLTVKAIVVSIIISCAFLSASAQQKIFITPYLKTDYSIISVSNPTDSSLRMKIYDPNGNVLYTQSIASQKNIQKLFDFTNLEDGTYKVVMTGRKTLSEKNFNVINKKLAIEAIAEKSERTIFRSTRNSLFVTYFSTRKKEIFVSITDSFGNQIFDADYCSKPTLSKGFDVSALPKGEYNVKVVSDQKTYDYAFQR